MGLIEQLQATLRWQERRELVRSSTDAAALLAWLPHEKEGWVRAAMAKVFGQLGGPESQTALERLVHDESGFVQVEAVKALDQLQTLASRFTLRETYAQAEDHLVRRAVVESQVPVGEAAGLGTLQAALAHETDPHSRALAIYNAMLEVGKAIVPTLRELWKTETEPEVRQMLVDLLANLGELEERQLLLSSLIQEPARQVRADIIRIFIKWGGRETRRVFLAALSAEPDESLQITLIQALTEWKDREVIRALYAHQRTTGSPSLSQVAQRAIYEMIDSMPLVELGIYLPNEPEAGIRLEIIKIVRHRGARLQEYLISILHTKSYESIQHTRQLVYRAREILVTALRNEKHESVVAEVIEGVVIWNDDEEIRSALYQWLCQGDQVLGVPTALSVLHGHYPADELHALAKTYFDSLKREA